VRLDGLRGGRPGIHPAGFLVDAEAEILGSIEGHGLFGDLNDLLFVPGARDTVIDV
jgi:hypothetical protein